MKNHSSKKLILLFLFCLSGILLSAQSKSNYWLKVRNPSTNYNKIERNSQPKAFQIFQLDLKKFKSVLELVSSSNTQKRTKGVVMDFPMPDGSIQHFKVLEAPIMEPSLSAKFPMIKTYKGIGLDDKTATMRFSVTQKGVHLFSLSGQRSSVFLDPYTEAGDTYMVYNRAALEQPLQDFECLTEDNVDLKSLKMNIGSNLDYKSDRMLRTYRLALSCNSKYGALFAGEGTDAEKKANILAQMAITINRVNEIYERDLAITLVFIDRNDELIYYDEASDPWSTEFNDKTQEVISTTLKDESLYDIGHNFNTSNGGQAGCIGCVCIDGKAPYTADSKGRGYTGVPNPTGDAFDIDFVAHEMGHQFGGYHTMNTCSRSGIGTTEVEPASGSSIMGYAGVCGNNNVQENTDAHFNYVNIRDITHVVQPGGTSDCGLQTPLDNSPPIANAGLDYTIPVSTPFVLKGNASDPDGLETLTYNWSQNDPERAPSDGAPNPTWVNGPLYRSILPTTSPNRYLPNLSDVVNGNLTPKWEVTPSVARTMNFAFTVRDNGSGFPMGIGQTDADLMTVNVVDGTPFTIAVPNKSKTWYVGNSYDVEWQVGETNKLPINCTKVNIKLSLDGGNTYPIELASNVDNDGLESVLIPDNPSDKCRIMVEAADNIFYDISDADFSIVKSGPIFVLEPLQEDTVYEICDINESLKIQIKYITVSGFNENTTFSVSELPTGISGTFEPESLDADGITTLSIKNFDMSLVGTHQITVTGISESITKSITQEFIIKSSQLETPKLIAPKNNIKDVSVETVLKWDATAYAEYYNVVVSKTSDFSTEILNSKVTNSELKLSNLLPRTTYYWKVKAANSCGESTESKPFNFETSACSGCSSSGSIEDGLETSITQVVFNTINNKSGKSAYSNFKDISTTLKKNEAYQLSVSVNTSGDYNTATMVWIDWNNNCSFEDLGESYYLGEANNTKDGKTSNSPLIVTVPDTSDLNDDILMRVSIMQESVPSSCAEGFFGEVEDYTLKVLPTLDVPETQFENFKIWPIPNHGKFTLSLTTDSSDVLDVTVFDISGRRVFNKSYRKNNYKFSELITLTNVTSGMYLLEVNNGNKKTIKKIIVE